MGEDRGGGKGDLEAVECGAAVISESPRNTLSGKPGQWDHDFGVFVDETPVEISEAEEGLDVPDLTGLGPILNGFYLVRGHRKPVRLKDVAEILHSLGVKFAFLRVG